MSNAVKLVIGDEVVWSMTLKKPLDYHVDHFHGQIWIAKWPSDLAVVYVRLHTREEALDQLIGSLRVLYRKFIIEKLPPRNDHERRIVELLKEQFEIS